MTLINCIFTISNITKDGKLNKEGILNYNKITNSAPTSFLNKIKQFLNMCDNEKNMFKCFQTESKRFGFKPDIEFDPFLKVNLSLSDFLNPKVDEAGVLKYCKASSLEATENIFVSYIKVTFTDCVY